MLSTAPSNNPLIDLFYYPELEDVQDKAEIARQELLHFLPEKDFPLEEIDSKIEEIFLACEVHFKAHLQ